MSWATFMNLQQFIVHFTKSLTLLTLLTMGRSLPNSKNQVAPTRKQLILFVPSTKRSMIEYVRSTYDPKASDLIDAHVTLVREHEVNDWELIGQKLKELTAIHIPLQFKPPFRPNGGGVLLLANGNSKEYYQYREYLLERQPGEVYEQKPHITLMHPRTSTSTNAQFSLIAKLMLPQEITFTEISIIEQEQGKPWNELHKFS